MSRPPSKVVYLGDIPFDLTEDQVSELLRSVGPLISFKLVHDRDKPRHRGYGFAEFATVEAATVAVNTFNNLQVKGRSLRADFSNQATGESNGRPRNNPPPSLPNLPPRYDRQSYDRQTDRAYDRQSERPYDQQYDREPYQQPYQQHQQQFQSQQPQQYSQQLFGQTADNTPGKQTEHVPSNLIVNDNISRTLSHFPPLQLVEVIVMLKSIISQNTSQAHDVLRSNPSLAYAVVQSLLLMGLVDANVVAQAVQGQQTVVPNRPTPTPTPVGSSQPPNNQQPSQNAPLPPPPPTAAAIDPQQAALIQQVLQLTDEQINFLPPDQKSTVLQLRDRYRQGIFT